MNKHPGFRIQTVAKRTGVPAATLRAWERRYGVPRPVRTDAAYRVYSEQDIEDIERIQQLCRGGMSVGEAAALLKQQVVETHTSEATEQPLRKVTARRSTALISEGTYDEVVSAFVEAAAAMDLDMMETTLAPITSLGPAADVFEKVLMPAMVQIGDLWHAGKLSVGHEHLATELVAGFARQLLKLAQPARPRHTAVLACFSEELHSVPLYGLGFRLLDWGCRSAILGALTPPAALAPAVNELQPELIGLSVTIAPQMSDARQLLEGYSSVCGDVPWIVGGVASPQLASMVVELGGIVAPTDEADLNQLIDNILEGERR